MNLFLCMHVYQASFSPQNSAYHEKTGKTAKNWYKSRREELKGENQIMNFLKSFLMCDIVDIAS